MAESGDLRSKLEKEYPWIPSEREHFGRPGTDYDFAARNPEEVCRGVVGPGWGRWAPGSEATCPYLGPW